MDYRALCVELFGTDDVEKIKQIARTYREKNARNAGRKKKFTQEQQREIRRLVEEGSTIKEVAERFQTSRQVIGKYLNQPPQSGYTLRMTYMYQQHPCTVVDVDFLNQKILVQNRTNDMLHRAFGVIENPTWNDFEQFLKDRCFPATRGDVKELLNQLQLTSYDPLQIAEKTKGRTAEDGMWLKFTYYPMKGAAHGQNRS